MASGIECAGLALAVLPIFIEVAKAYSDGVETIFDVAIKSRWDQRLEDFYFEFYMQLFYLNECMQKIHEGVLETYTGPGNVPQSMKLCTEWRCDSNLERGLRQYFGSEGRFNAFTIISKKTLLLLQQLVKDKTNRVAAKDQNPEAMFSKIEKIAIARELETTKSSLVERFAFFRHREKRDCCIRKLKLWVENLEKLTQEARTRPKANLNEEVGPSKVRSSGKNDKGPPSIQLRNLIANLYPVFQKHCQCGCPEEHDVKLCLKDSYESATLHPSLELDFLLSKDLSTSSPRDIRWQEGNVLVTSQCLSSSGCHGPLQALCEVFGPDLQNHSIALVLEDTSGQQCMKHHKTTLRKFQFLEASDPISLAELLDGSTKLDPSEKRRLALVFAQSLLLYHDSDWISNGWTKEDICFFFKSEDEPEVSRPFLSARFNNAPTTGNPFRRTNHHRNPSILALGILLIEIFNEKPIERWRTTKERKNPNAATMWMVADRVVKKMDHSPFREAIEACLDMNWVPAGRVAGLEDRETRAGLLENVIMPLKQEISWLSVDKLP